MNKQISKVWTFASDSNPSTLQFLDGSTSCNCKGWTRRVASDSSSPICAWVSAGAETDATH